MSILSNQYLWAGAFIGATLAAGYLVTGKQVAIPAAFAQERAAEAPADLSNFVRFGEREYDIAFGAGVDTTAISSVTVRKIAYGHESAVNVVTTSTGTYSTDGLVSPHVLYPGVEVSERIADTDGAPEFAIESGPFEIYADRLPSFVRITPMPQQGELILTDRFSCAVRLSTVVCI